jgi:hypothetical protein
VAGNGNDYAEERDTEVTAMTATRKRTLVLTYIVLLGLFSLAVSQGSGEPHPPGEGTAVATFYVA